jgi:hypothetical protein
MIPSTLTNARALGVRKPFSVRALCERLHVPSTDARGKVRGYKGQLGTSAIRWGLTMAAILPRSLLLMIVSYWPHQIVSP